MRYVGVLVFAIGIMLCAGQSFAYDYCYECDYCSECSEDECAGDPVFLQRSRRDVLGLLAAKKARLKQGTLGAVDAGGDGPEAGAIWNRLVRSTQSVTAPSSEKPAVPIQRLIPKRIDS
jgi:hypothetical protein